MAEAFYSIVLDHPAEAVWSVIRPFGHYAWAGVDAETVIEDGKADAEVGAVRCVAMPGRTIRQKLLAHSDRERSYTYSFLEPAPVPNYVATIRVTPVAETSQAGPRVPSNSPVAWPRLIIRSRRSAIPAC